MKDDGAANGAHPGSLAKLAVAAIGVVYGDIGTSPLYTFRECFGHVGLALTEANVLGVLSLIFWAIFIVVTLKYVLLIMRADNRGEGGILALASLAMRGLTDKKRRALIVLLSMAGAALFYGDGLITPAISVLSAVEGLKVATPLFEPYIVPIAVVVLVGLFVIQSRGTARVGAYFGPVMVLWFLTLATLGFLAILQRPGVLAAVNPLHAVALFAREGVLAFILLGAVVLAVTGAEALYADMGHFGRRPIRLAWFAIVMPALLLNYFGQGALLLDNADAVVNPFYFLAPSWALYPMVILATAATVIASQAVISGAFSLSRQAVQLGYLPRLNILHTSEQIGQIYVPRINWALLTGVLVLVLGFQSSSALAAAYGIAVTGTMAIDSVLVYVVARFVWGWSLWRAALAIYLFLTVDLAFLGANILKIPDGGWFPILLGIAIFTIMRTWRRGRAVLFDRLYRDALPITDFLKQVLRRPPQRVAGTAVFMTGNPGFVPTALLHNLKHNKVLHERVVLMTIVTEDAPWVAPDKRLTVEHLDGNVHTVVARYGFKEDPDVPTVMNDCRLHDLAMDPMDTSFFLSRETFIRSPRRDLGPLAERIFIFLSKTAFSAPEFFRIPPNRVVEMGTQIDI